MHTPGGYAAGFVRYAMPSCLPALWSPQSCMSAQTAAPRQPLKPRNGDGAAQPLKARTADDATRHKPDAAHQHKHDLPQKSIRRLPPKRIRMLPARGEPWTAPLRSPPRTPRERPCDLEASMDGSVVMALGTPTPVLVREAPPSSLGAVAQLGSLDALALNLRAPRDAAAAYALGLYNRTWRDFDEDGRAPPVHPGAALSADEVRRLRGGLAVPVTAPVPPHIAPPPAPPRSKWKGLLKAFKWRTKARVAPTNK